MVGLVVVLVGGAFVLGRVTTTSDSTATPDFGDFAGDWYWHGQVVTIKPDGTGTATWRVYKWCTDNPQPPCDGDVGSQIVDGGNAAFVLRRREGSTAYGTVLQSSDTATLPVSDIALVLLPRDHLQFPGLGNGPLCGPTAPSDCGA